MFLSVQVMFLVVPYLPASEEDKYCLNISKSEKLCDCTGGACKLSSCLGNVSQLMSEGQGRRSFVFELVTFLTCSPLLGTTQL